MSAFCIFTGMFYIYILYSRSADRYYVGHTDDYLRRLDEHSNSERNTYTSKHRPWELKAVFECGDDRGEAQKIELFIKKQKSRKLIEGIIHGQLLTGILAQLVRVPHVRH
ncbi:MAG: GIY-YIG nuclease family protein [Bacteroidales bacterium]|nr:GIY-YIG nuclease family protein [Bacteroidales bacterium]